MEFGEVDSTPQFKSVKDTVSMLDGFWENKCTRLKSRTCLPEKIMAKMKTQYEVGEENKLADNITSKLYNSFPSRELQSTANVTLEFLKMELTSLKTEHSKLTLEESLTGSIIFGLKSQKLELNACLAEECAARGQLNGLIAALQEMLLETRDARKEEENEMRFTTNDTKKQAEAAHSYLSQVGNEIKLVLQEAEEAKSSEARILDQIKALSEKAIPPKDSTPESITIPEEEFEYLIQRIYNSDTIAEMKVAAAGKHVEASKASEHKALNELKGRRKQIEDMQAVLDIASKKAQAAEAAKKAFIMQYKRDQKKSASQTSSITETQAYPLIGTSELSLITPQVKITKSERDHVYSLCHH